MKSKENSIPRHVMRRLRRDFLSGIIVIVPLSATILLLWWLFVSIDGILSPAIDALFNRHIPGVGFIAIVVIIYLAGVAANNVIGSQILKRSESLLTEVPMVREIYKTFRQVLESVVLPNKGGFKEAVLVEFPRPGMKTIGFVTNTIKDSSGQELVNVYIPTTPNPTSGYLEIVSADDIVHLDMTVEDAIKMIVSGGMVAPEVIASIDKE
ncbi:MAG: DUF502 domain-containing protein [Chloroflexota bacterium]|nr:DUF502 domain-containing protein [Chloroflexota bacterium]